MIKIVCSNENKSTAAVTILPVNRLRHAVILGALLLGSTTAMALEIDSGNPDLTIRWDTNLKYSAMYRLKQASDTLTADLNQDDGDRNFDQGLVSNRVDVLSEIDLTYNNLGVRVSGAGWYDQIYQQDTDNDSTTGNAASVDQTEFTDDTRDLHGQKAEILDAFLFGRFDMAGAPTIVRVGKHTQVYGETLFFGANGIAAAQGPVDAVKALSVPNTQFKELLMPVNQVSLQTQLNSAWTLGGYYQLSWKKTRLPASGSYFSTIDFLADGAEQLWLAPGFAATREDDLEARDSGQGGMQLRFTPRSIDAEFGFYAARYHDKTPQIYLTQFAFPPAVPAPTPTAYRWVYPEDIQTLGTSVSTLVGDANVAAEVSMRSNMPLVSTGQADVMGTGDNRDNPLYAVGRTAHANVSMIYSFTGGALFDNAFLVGEIGWNRLLKVTDNPDALDPGAERDALGLRLTLEPAIYQVLSGLDLTIPMGLGYNPKGKSAVLTSFNGGADKGGDVSIGLKGDYRRLLRMSLTYNHYFGTEKTSLRSETSGYVQNYGQALKDRDYLSVSAEYSF
ncbi:DUF1302 domain-containing protein [Candidatus Thalassolituus haligoni]|uniref:DUF1302 domain-containing protein n=1 Tax=Candidatus Thalassolituus haligoni TaxID=3100113 RepID=UPI003518C973